MQCSLVPVYHVLYALVDLHVSTGAKLISTFLISIHVFLCTKLISNCLCSSISTKFAYGVTVWK